MCTAKEKYREMDMESSRLSPSPSRGAVSCSICLDPVEVKGERSVARLKCAHLFHLGKPETFLSFRLLFTVRDVHLCDILHVGKHFLSSFFHDLDKHQAESLPNLPVLDHTRCLSVRINGINLTS